MKKVAYETSCLIDESVLASYEYPDVRVELRRPFLGHHYVVFTLKRTGETRWEKCWVNMWHNPDEQVRYVMAHVADVVARVADNPTQPRDVDNDEIWRRYGLG